MKQLLKNKQLAKQWDKNPTHYSKHLNENLTEPTKCLPFSPSQTSKCTLVHFGKILSLTPSANVHFSRCRSVLFSKIYYQVFFAVYRRWGVPAEPHWLPRPCWFLLWSVHSCEVVWWGHCGGRCCGGSVSTGEYHCLVFFPQHTSGLLQNTKTVTGCEVICITV